MLRCLIGLLAASGAVFVISGIYWSQNSCVLVKGISDATGPQCEGDLVWVMLAAYWLSIAGMAIAAIGALAVIGYRSRANRRQGSTVG